MECVAVEVIIHLMPSQTTRDKAVEDASIIGDHVERFLETAFP